jgi:imidazolonepropionase-like amidohydrolase
MNTMNTQHSLGSRFAAAFVAFATFVTILFMPSLLVPRLFAPRLFAQSGVSVPTPAAPTQAKAVYLVGGTIHVGNGTVLERGVIGFEGGKISVIGGADTKYDAANADVVLLGGKHVYPGFIAANTTLGLVELEAVRSTVDFAEVGSINPHVRSLIAYNAQSQIIPTVRFNGVLLALVAPQGGLVSGRSSVMELDGWNWEDAAMKSDVGIHVNFPSTTRSATEADAKQRDETIAKQLAALTQFFREAQAYSRIPASNTKAQNQKFEAMRGLFDGSKKLFVRTDEARSILAAVQFAKEFGITPIIVGGADAHLVADFLKTNNVPVMFEQTHALPERDNDDTDQSYKTPAQLVRSGVLTCLSVRGSWQQRNIPFQAGTAAGFGLTKEEALALVTANTAKVLGVDDRVGTLERGKDATLFVSEGDALDMRGNNVTEAYIRGRKIQLVNKQKFLYEQYKSKYGTK